MTPPQPVQTGMATVDALALLPLPAHLSGHQLDGHVCVWGGEALTTDSAVDLGSRRIGDRMAFPRACGSCTARAAQGVLFDHTGDCPDCSTPAPQETAPALECATARALYRVIRQGQR